MKKQTLAFRYFCNRNVTVSSTKLCSAETKNVLTLYAELARTREKVIVTSFLLYFHTPIKELEETKCTLSIE